MRGGKTKSKGKHLTRKVARSAMGALMPPVDVTSSRLVKDLDSRIKTGPLTLVLVYADWCGHCTSFKPMMKELETLPNRSVQIARVREDVYPNTSLAAKNKVEGYPSLMLVDTTGTAMKFKQPSGEVTNTVPDRTDMKKMSAIVRTAGTPEGMTLLNSLNKNLNKNKNAELTGVTAMEEPVAVTNSSMQITSPRVTAETVEPLSASNFNTAKSQQASNYPTSIVADRLNTNTVVNENAKLTRSKNKSVRALAQMGGSMSENFCGSSCSVPQMGGGLLGALTAAATNVAPAVALFLASEAVQKRTKGRGKSRKSQRGGCGCGLTRRANRG